MRSPWRTFRTLVTVYYAEMMQYRAELYLWAMSGVMPFILMGLWVKASSETAFGMGPIDFARYFLAVFVIRQITIVWVVWDFEHHVVNGKLSPLLLQPLDPVWRFLLSHVGERFARGPFVVLLIALFFIIYPKSFWIPPINSLLLAMVVMLQAFLMRFVMQFTFAMIAFWSERANAIEDLWFMLYLFLSGFIAPLEVFPPAVRTIAECTPFPHMIYLPAKLLMGDQQVAVGRGILVMLIWGIAFLVLYRWLWHRGLRRYSAMGA